MPHPLIFRINSTRTKKTVFCGVLEFVAPEDVAVLPLWVFNNLGIMEEEMINIALISVITKSTFLKLRPH